MSCPLWIISAVMFELYNWYNNNDADADDNNNNTNDDE